MQLNQSQKKEVSLPSIYALYDITKTLMGPTFLISDLHGAEESHFEGLVEGRIVFVVALDYFNSGVVIKGIDSSAITWHEERKKQLRIKCRSNKLSERRNQTNREIRT